MVHWRMLSPKQTIKVARALHANADEIGKVGMPASRVRKLAKALMFLAKKRRNDAVKITNDQLKMIARRNA